MTDRRKITRERALRGAVIEFHPVGEARCMIRNISSTGALLEMGSPVALPNKFVLAVLSNHTRRHCRVVWRDRNRLGVAFDGPEYSNRPTPAPRSSKPGRTDLSASIKKLVRAALANSAAH
jgi:PilZ domain